MFNKILQYKANQALISHWKQKLIKNNKYLVITQTINNIRSLYIYNLIKTIPLSNLSALYITIPTISSIYYTSIFDFFTYLILMMNHRGWFERSIQKIVNAMTPEDITTQNADHGSLKSINITTIIKYT